MSNLGLDSSVQQVQKNRVCSTRCKACMHLERLGFEEFLYITVQANMSFDLPVLPVGTSKV